MAECRSTTSKPVCGLPSRCRLQFLAPGRRRQGPRRHVDGWTKRWRRRAALERSSEGAIHGAAREPSGEERPGSVSDYRGRPIVRHRGMPQPTAKHPRCQFRGEWFLGTVRRRGRADLDESAMSEKLPPGAPLHYRVGASRRRRVIWSTVSGDFLHPSSHPPMPDRRTSVSVRRASCRGLHTRGRQKGSGR